MKCYQYSTLLIVISGLGLLPGLLLVSCGDKKKKSSQELESSGYQATPADFLRAAGDGDIRVLKLLVKQEIDPKSIDAQRMTAVHLAAQGNHEEAVTYLLDLGLDINATNSNGKTALMLAAGDGKATMVRFLLKQGAKPELKDGARRSALILAVDGDQPASVEELAPYSRDQLDTALLYAAAQGKHSVIPALTSFGASVYTRHEGGMTPLMLAAQNGHTTTVHALLESGSNRYAINEHGWTAAQVAAAADQEAIATLLNREPDATELSLTAPGDDEPVAWPDPQGKPQSVTPTKPTAVTKNTQPETQSDMPWNRPTGPEGAGALGILDSPKPTHAKPPGVPSKPTRQLSFIAGKTLSSRAATPEQVSQDLRMRDYQQTNLPLMVEKVTPKAVEVRMLYGTQKNVTVRQGDTIPGTPFRIVSIRRKFHDSKMNDGKPADISVVEIEDTRTGNRRQLTTQIPATATEPWAVLEDKTSRQTYAARVGQSFTTANGESYTITDVRPSQILLTHKKSGQVITIPLGR